MRLINGLQPALTPAGIFIFSTTILYYNFHDRSSQLNYSSLLALKQSVILMKIPLAELLLLLICSLLSLWTLYFLSFKIILLLSFIGMLSMMYSIPLILWRKKFLRIREILFFKIGIIAFSWALMSVLVPIMEADIFVPPLVLLGQLISMALFIYALCIPFEIRDVQIEMSRGLRTIPIVYGIRISRYSGVLALLAGTIIQILLYSGELISLNTLFAIILSYIISLLFILLSSDKPSDFYCKFYIDGMMILQFLLIFVSLKI